MVGKTEKISSKTRPAIKNFAITCFFTISEVSFANWIMNSGAGSSFKSAAGFAVGIFIGLSRTWYSGLLRCPVVRDFQSF